MIEYYNVLVEILTRMGKCWMHTEF